MLIFFRSTYKLVYTCSRTTIIFSILDSTHCWINSSRSASRTDGLRPGSKPDRTPFSRLVRQAGATVGLFYSNPEPTRVWVTATNRQQFFISVLSLEPGTHTSSGDSNHSSSQFSRSVENIWNKQTKSMRLQVQQRELQGTRVQQTLDIHSGSQSSDKSCQYHHLVSPPPDVPVVSVPVISIICHLYTHRSSSISRE